MEDGVHTTPLESGGGDEYVVPFDPAPTHLVVEHASAEIQRPGATTVALHRLPEVVTQISPLMSPATHRKAVLQESERTCVAPRVMLALVHLGRDVARCELR